MATYFKLNDKEKWKIKIHRMTIEGPGAEKKIADIFGFNEEKIILIAKEEYEGVENE